MKNYSIVFLWLFCIAFAISGCKGGPKSVKELSSKELAKIEKSKSDNDNWTNDVRTLTYPLPATPLISAHRGGKHIDNYPENCLETFQHLAEVGEKIKFIIECDIAQSADGIFFLMHDNTLDRTTTGSGKAATKDWEYIKALKLKDHRGIRTSFNPPLLSDVLKWAKNRAYLALDIKGSLDRNKLLKELGEHRAFNYAEIITYNLKDAKFFYERAPEFMLSVGIMNEKGLDRALDTGIPTNRMKAFVGTRRKSADFISLLHEQKIIATLGTLGNIDGQAKARGFKIYDELIENGIDVFATDYPLEVYSYYYNN